MSMDEATEAFGPIVLEGETAGFRWRFRAAIVGDEYRSGIEGVDENGEGNIGSGGAGSLRFVAEDDRLTKLLLGIHVGVGPAFSTVLADDDVPMQCHVEGLVSIDVGRVVVVTTIDSIKTTIVDVGDERVAFFCAVFHGAERPTAVIAYGRDGQELDRQEMFSPPGRFGLRLGRNRPSSSGDWSRVEDVFDDE
jgi:hypothetical protein